MAQGPLFKAVAALLCACGAAAAGAALSGCGAGEALDPVAKAAELTEEAPGFSAHFTLEATVSGKTVTTSGTETYDTQDRSGVAKLSVDGAATQEAILSKNVTYTHLTASESAALGGKPWSELEQERIDSAMGIELSSLSSTQSSNPSQYLTYLRATGAHPKKAGSEVVEGVHTTRYNATIDYSRYAQTLPPEKRAAASKSGAALERATGSATLPVSAWIDGEGRVRRMELSIPECLTVVGSGPVHLLLHMRVEFSSFAAQAPPTLPASGEVENITGRTLETLKDVTLGCS